MGWDGGLRGRKAHGRLIRAVDAFQFPDDECGNTEGGGPLAFAGEKLINQREEVVATILVGWQIHCR